MFIVDQAAYVRAATHALLSSKPFESLVDYCRRHAAEEAAAKVVSFAAWREKLRPSATVITER
jgi:hypothetical protein